MSSTQGKILHTATWCVALASMFVSVAAAAQVPLNTIYATGVDTNGQPLAEGATDPHWDVAVDNGAFVDAIYDKNNFCSSCGGIWIDWPLGNQNTSRGITHPSHVRDRDAPSRFVWRQAFNVPADADTATITVSYKVGYDDVSRNAMDDGNAAGCNHTVWLNGTPYAMTSMGDNQRTECVGTIPAGSAFVNGQNTIEFRIANLSTVYGFRLEDVQASYQVATVCGDGLVEGTEACDDGNTVDGDGCSATCGVEQGFECAEPEFVFNGDFELGDTGAGGILSADLMPIPSRCGDMSDTPRDGFYNVTSSPYHSCTCDGGQGLCLAINGGGGVVWSQKITGLAPNTTYTVSARHALKGERSDANEPRLQLNVDGMTLASAEPTTSTAPIPYETISATFTTGAAQTTALIEFVNTNAVAAGNDSVLDTISVTGPSVCAPPCGDGVIGVGEGCDDGNDVDGDGCSSTCDVEDGWICENEPSVCVLLCGNGTVDAGEACDDGNTASGDGCSATCVDERVSLVLYSTGVDDSGTPLADGATDTHWVVANESNTMFVPAINDQNNFCSSCGGIWLEWPIGNASTSRGITHPDHVRDRNTVEVFTWRQTFNLPADAKPDTATITYLVGFDNASRNAMDDGDLTGCNHTVWLNGTPYAMTATGDPYRTECQGTIPAGSAFVNGANTIEFRINNVSTVYGFRLDTIEGSFLQNCGDGALVEGETCDDGNTDDGDGCSATCQIEEGYVCQGEPSMCQMMVAEPECGDGVIEGNEACDDGNVADGDGCSASCAIEEGYACQGAPSMCTQMTQEPVCGDGNVDAGEACDDGNTVDGDGCSADCQKEAQMMETPPRSTNTGNDEGCSTTGHAPSHPWVLTILLGLMMFARRRRD